jgi:hypothetical protein
MLQKQLLEKSLPVLSYFTTLSAETQAVNISFSPAGIAVIRAWFRTG